MIKFCLLNDRLKRYTIICVSSLALTIGSSSATLAQSNLIPPSPAVCDLDLAALKSGDVDRDRNIVTADTVSAQGTTTPSLWWTSEQFPPKLIANWVADRNQKQIYLLVNSQYWNILDYIDRYRTIDKFGRVAQGYGYNLKICNSQKITLADYACESTGTSNPNICQIWLNANGQNGLGVMGAKSK
jgi:hypothetical protein